MQCCCCRHLCCCWQSIWRVLIQEISSTPWVPYWCCSWHMAIRVGPNPGPCMLGIPGFVPSQAFLLLLGLAVVAEEEEEEAQSPVCSIHVCNVELLTVCDCAALRASSPITEPSQLLHHSLMTLVAATDKLTCCLFPSFTWTYWHISSFRAIPVLLAQAEQLTK